MTDTMSRPSTPGNGVATTSKELKDTLWKAADKLRGSMGAGQYKDVVLGLVFLKYVSDAFEERRDAIRAELAGEDPDYLADTLEEADEYLGEGVFWVAPEARWDYISANAKGIPATATRDAQSIGEIIDHAMRTISSDNRALAGTLPTMFGRDNIDQRRLGELVDLFNSARFTGEGATKARDLLGEVYEYFLDKFAKAEGKRGGEFYTPPVLVQTLVEILEPDEGRVYDPCCGSGGMFVQAEKFLTRHDQDPTKIAVYGQELNEQTWRMAKMNLAIHGIDSTGLGSRWGDTFARDIHRAWRQSHPFIVSGWKQTHNKLTSAFVGKQVIEDKCVAYEGAGQHGFMHLPSGMSIRYDNVEQGDDLTYIKSFRLNVTKEPTIKRERLYGGLEVENRTQALARIVVSDHALAIADALKDRWQLVMTTHDELVGVVPARSANRALKVVKSVMSQAPSWAPGLPIAVDAHISQRYDK